MRSPVLDNLLRDDSVQTILSKAERLVWESQIELESTYSASDWATVCRTAFLLSTAALTSSIEEKDYAVEAYNLLAVYPIYEREARETLESIVGFDFQDAHIIYYFYLASLALKLDKTITARLVLNRYDATEVPEEANWDRRTLYIIMKSLLLLVRKHKGIEDIREALRLIEILRRQQKLFEDEYISNIPLQEQQQKALSLVAVYHVSKAVYDTAEYLVNGYNQQQRRITSSVRQHIDIAMQLIDKQSRLNDFFKIIGNDLQLLIKNSIWSLTGFHDDIRRLCRAKANSGVLELLPSQQSALEDNMLNVAANAIVLQMPTSAGKTLMAEFNILVTRSLRSDAKIVYVVPSRALMNQVYFDLRDDLCSLGLTIERTSSAVEVDPTESRFLLSERIDILVCTPEKLDLLIRRGHSSVEDVSLFIIDEAHTIANGQRGARLELLMTMLKRERPNAKFMLLSPFLPNAGEIMSRWLGGGNSIQIDWRPSEKIVLGLKLNRGKVKYTVLPTALGTTVTAEQTLEKKEEVSFVSKGRKQDILEYSAKKFGVKGRTQLILCKGRMSANKQAKFLSDMLQTPESISDDVKLVCKYIDEEIGEATLYTQLLAKGVAVHHAGLSDEAKILTEHLIRKGDIRYVCATTTIAEGVNFPVASVYFDTYYRGRDSRGRSKQISANDFWNIAGRAGRTMVDDYGKIILPFNTNKNEAIARDLIRHGAEQLSSVLAQLFHNRDDVLAKLSADNAIWNLTVSYPDSFGPLFQYFVHLLNVAESDYAADVEDLFKDSLAYTLLNDIDKDAFIDMCKRIYLSIQSTYSNRHGALKFADKTGFSVPSVLSIMKAKSSSPSIADLDGWSAASMFDAGNIGNLKEKIKVVATLKETGLGTDSKQSSFNPELVSRILIGWVKGEKLNQMSRMHPHFSKEKESANRVSEFVSYMNDIRFKASWGLGALEGIVRGNEDDLKDSYIPSYVYYGVVDPKPLAMRMLGVPRSLSPSLSQVIEQGVEKYSFSQLRGILKGLSMKDWDALSPQGSSLAGAEWKRIVEILLR